jgi:2-methylcitrate dehydratase PrpD
MTTDDISHHLAQYIAASRFEDLPEAAVDRAKKSLLDTMGVILAAGGTVPAINAVMELVREHGGHPTCSVLGFGDRVPPLMAAFANGAMAHCLDYDDVAPDGNHASSSLIPAAIAAAEHVGGVSGKELITAVAIGQDVFLRLRRSLLNQRLDWLVTTVFGVFSATAAAARVLRLTKGQTINAMGIASLGCCGTLEMRFGTGSELGELYAGFVAKNALLSAMMAKKSVTGLQRVFEGPAGIMKVYFQNDFDRNRVLDGIGKTFNGSSMQYKPWPICGIANTYVHAVLGLVRRHGLKDEDIVELRAYVGDFQQRMCTPLEERRRPTLSMDARFSMPFCLGAAAAYGEVKIEQFTAAGLKDPKILAMADRVIPINDSAFDWTGAMPDARIEIVTRDGRSLSGTAGSETPGNAGNPMEWDDLAGKFADCAANAPRPIAPEQVARVVEMAKMLESIADATDLARLLA